MKFTKTMDNIQGYVEFELSFYDSYSELGISEEIYEYGNFNNLEELLILLSDEHLEEIKEQFDCQNVSVSSVTFRNSDDGVNLDLKIGNWGTRLYLQQEINSSEIESENKKVFEKIKDIVDEILS